MHTKDGKRSENTVPVHGTPSIKALACQCRSRSDEVPRPKALQVDEDRAGLQSTVPLVESTCYAFFGITQSAK